MDELAILEDAYRLDAGPEEWLRGLLARIGEASGAPGVFACEVRIPPDGAWVELRAPAVWGVMTEDAIEHAQQLHDRIPHDFIVRSYTAPSCARQSEVFDASGVDRGFAERYLRWLEQVSGAPDAWRCVAADPDGRGVLFGGSLPAGASPLRPATRDRWHKIAAHVASAHRLRRRLGEARSLASADGVYELDGCEKHLEGAARSHRERLRQAVDLHRRCRSRTLTAREALDAWTALLEGRWSVVEQVDTDGRRLLVAHRNAVPVPPARALGRREREVVEYAAHGHPNKIIAYELGVSEAAVSSHLSSALRKLGLASRVALIRYRQAVAAAAAARGGHRATG